MDGASKFVRGDAVAGILILAINILGGITIGVAQYSLSLGEAASLYTILSIGDGLVAQIPSLLLSIGTAIIVTRVSSSGSMSEHIGGQISIPQAWYPVAVVIGIMGLVPGMPSVLFLSLAAITGMIGFMISRYAGRAETPDMIDSFADEEYEEDNSTVSAEQITGNSRITVVVSYPLISFLGEEVNVP